LPELPEVEIYRRYFEAHALGRRVSKVAVRDPRILGETTAVALRGALVGQGKTDSTSVLSCAQHFAIVLDGQIQSAPYIDFVRNPEGIPGDNGAQIDIGAGGLGDAKRLALALQTGALPVQFVRLP